MRVRSRTLLAPGSDSSFFLPFEDLFLSSRSLFSTSSRAFLKSFWPPCRSWPFSSMSSRARSLRRRSLSDSPKRRMGWPLARNLRTVSSFEMLYADSGGLGDSVSRSFAVNDCEDVKGVYSPSMSQDVIKSEKHAWTNSGIVGHF